MLEKKLVITVIVTFVLSMAFGFLVHGTILHGEYAKLSFMRSESAAQALFGFMFLANFAYACGFSWIYVRGREPKPWLGQGLRYGIAVTLITVVPMYLIYYVVAPFPSDLVAQQIVYDAICTIVLGIVVAWLNR